MSDREQLRKTQEILQLVLGWNDSDVPKLALQARDLIWSDRQIIKILGRNIESLTMQMKEITDVTFERDNLIEYNDRLNDIIGNMRLEIDTLKERLAKYE